MAASTRTDGFAALADYGVLGDGRTVALVATDGSVDWWPIPTLDAPPVCAAILDPVAGGSFVLVPEGDFEARRRYLPGTNVLETVYTTEGGSARVTEALNTGSSGRLPWNELVRRVDGIVGHVPMRWAVIPGQRFGNVEPTITDHDGTPIIRLDDQTLAVLVDGMDPGVVSDTGVRGRFVAEGGHRALLAVVATDDEPLFLPPIAAIDRRLDRTVESWRRWRDLIDYDGPWAEAVIRSALALKTLLYEPGGAIAAAATTSLPEKIGGPKNWDYRYAWIRDSSFTLDAFIALGLHEEVHASVSWLIDAMRRSEPELHIFYDLEGGVPEGETRLDAPGYRASRPVRAGNDASSQTQLGIYGDLFDTVHRYVQAGHLLDPHTAELLAGYADRCVKVWDTRDSGIWELSDLEHYTISKIGCWMALDRAGQLAAAGQLPDDRMERWRDQAAEIRTWVHAHCWSEAKQSYTFYAGTEDLDASVLLAGRTGFDRGPRLASTIDAVVSELGSGIAPLLYRYTGMGAEEGAFVACTFWLVDALVHTGQIDQARRVMDDAVTLGNDVGILSEQVDPASGASLGNLPQGLSHLALINAAHTLGRALPSP
ncbi:MAG: glycoside hydrolase family 15 protein [Actinomycetota bacterium]|nr:glycoside hydrolase family 15 protein [Actinomycetota bacterium]